MKFSSRARDGSQNKQTIPVQPGEVWSKMPAMEKGGSTSCIQTQRPTGSEMGVFSRRGYWRCMQFIVGPATLGYLQQQGKLDNLGEKKSNLLL